jgi:hypothetical protein
MGMAAHELVHDATEHSGDRELGPFRGNLRVEHDLEQQVTELLAQCVGTAALESLQHFVRFFDEIGLERGRGLRAVPRAAAWPTEAVHDLKELLEEDSGGLDHIVT